MKTGHRVHIGERQIWGGREPFGISAADRRQHVYIIGKTGTGKSTLLRNMIVQDIEAGAGVGLIDPHGDLAEEVLDHIPPSRTRHVMYFNPQDQDYPIGFNLLRSGHDQRHLVASGIVSAFKNVWRDSWGPRLEYILYGAVAALACVNNASLLGVHRMLSDENYRKWVVRQIDDPLLRSLWASELARYDKRLFAEAIAPLQNKIGQLVMSPLVRNIVGQVRNRVDPSFLMDNDRIFIANLAKGTLGEDKSSLLGSLLVTAFQLAALGRSDRPESERNNWYLYVDEFQSFATDSFASTVSEARKYGLCLTLSHQYTRQLRPEIQDAVFGNVGTFISFRVSEADAEALEREYGGRYSASTFTDLGNFEMLVKAIKSGEQSDPFRARTFSRAGRRYDRRERIVRRCRDAYTTPRRIVENRISRWMQK